MMRLIQLCLALLSMTALVLGETHEMVERMYMSRKTGTDLSPEATGFIFRKDNDGPASYVKLGAGVVHKHLDKYPSEYYTYPVVPEVFAIPPIPLAHAKWANVNQEQAAPKSEKIIVAPAEEESEEENEESHGILHNDSSDVDDDYQSKFDGYKGSDHDDFTGYGDDSGFDDHGFSGFEGHRYGRGFGSDIDFDGHSFGGQGGFVGNTGYDGGKYAYGVHHGVGDDFSYGGGRSYNGDRYSGYDEEGTKGYRGHRGFENSGAGQHGTEGYEEHYSKGADEKGAKYDENDEYGKHYSAGKEYKSGSSGENEGHSKGVKTTGFHNVYHKDEYKKDKEMYDESAISGHSNKHGGEAAHHDVSHGAHEKGSQHKSAQHHDNFRNEGLNEVGHKYSTDSGHEGKHGADSYQNDKSDFSNRAGSSHKHEHVYDGKLRS